MAHPAQSESRDSAHDGSSSAAPGAARTQVGVTALTHHDDFLLELGECLGGRASVQPAESIDAALEQLGAVRGGQVLAIDARKSGDVRADVEQASKRTPHAVVLVFTDAGAEKTVAAAVKGTKVFAVLPLPMEPGKTAAVLEAAMADALRNSAPAQPAPARPSRRASAEAEAATAGSERTAGGRSKRLWLAVGAGVLVIAVGAGIFLMQRHPAAPSMTAAHGPGAHAHGPIAALHRPAVDTSIVRGRVENLLEKASRAMFERHFTAPRGANALVYYRSVLAVDPTNGEALNGLLRVSNVLISQFRDAMAQGHYNGAALALATLRLAEPSDTHIRPFGIELSQAVVNQAFANGQRSALPTLIAQAARRGVPATQIAAWQSKLTHLKHEHRIQAIAKQIAHRIDVGRLTGAASAQSALARLRTLAPTAPATQSAGQALLEAMLYRARQAGLRGQTAAENTWLAAARRAGATTQALAAARAQIRFDRARVAHGKVTQMLARARARLAAGALLRPGNDSAAYYLTAIAAAHPDPSEAAAADRLRSALAGALVARAKSQAHAGQHAAALADLAAAHHWGASVTALHAAAALATPASPPTSAQLAEVARQLRRTHYVAPSYPQRALEQRVAGQVTVQYTVGRSGRTRDVRVISATPPRVFNRAVLEAIRRWRYAPPMLHGKPIDVPVRTMIRFVLPN